MLLLVSCYACVCIIGLYCFALYLSSLHIYSLLISMNNLAVNSPVTEEVALLPACN